MTKEYGVWGYFTDYFYNFLNFLFEKKISDINLMNTVLAIQVASIWSIVIYKIIKFLNYYSLIIFISPFILDFFAVGTRDAIALGLFLILMLGGFTWIKFLISTLISFFIHKGIFPLILTNALINKFKNKSKKFFLLISFFSFLVSVFIYFILKYTDIASYLPDNFYRHILSFPRYGVLGTEKINVEFFGERNIAYNFYGNFNFKILSFGITGQLISVFFKSKLPSNIFCLCFSVFFVCSALSTIPNADRFIYHTVLLSAPFYFELLFFQIHNFYKRIKTNLHY